jgi:hypothetical protein
MDYCPQQHKQVPAPEVFAKESGMTTSIISILLQSLFRVSPADVADNHFGDERNFDVGSQRPIRPLAIFREADARIFVKQANLADYVNRGSEVTT